MYILTKELETTFKFYLAAIVHHVNLNLHYIYLCSQRSAAS